MDMKKYLIGATAIAGFALAAQSASADVICGGCEYLEEPTYLGLYNPETFDNGNFVHDRWPVESIKPKRRPQHRYHCAIY